MCSIVVEMTFLLHQDVCNIIHVVASGRVIVTSERVRGAFDVSVSFVWRLLIIF